MPLGTLRVQVFCCGDRGVFCIHLGFSMGMFHSGRRFLRETSLAITKQGPRRGRACLSMTRAQHRAASIYAGIDDEKVIVLWEHMLVNQMHTSSLRNGADFIAVFDKAFILN